MICRDLTPKIGDVVVEAETEAKASIEIDTRSNLTKAYRAANVRVECLQRPQAGFLGIGKRPGRWRMTWHTGAQYAILVKWWPEQITANCLPENLDAADTKHFPNWPPTSAMALTLLASIGKTSISVGRQETLQLKVTGVNTPSNMPGNESELGG